MEQHIFKKKYGQNFLNDQNILKKIYESINPTKDDLIIEIGPGSGNLTKWLKKYNCHILCYEIDNSLESTLSKLEDNKVKVLYQDFLEADINGDIKNISYQNVYVVANIPYYITTPIIEKITSSDIKPSALVLMMQKEVGDRLTSKPNTKDYGYITVLLNYFYEIKKLFIVNKNSFYPVPKVDSVVIKFLPVERKNIDFNKFNNLIKASFQFKRKNLRNNLKSYNLEIIENILNKYGYSLNDRAENIPLEVFIELTDNL